MNHERTSSDNGGDDALMRHIGRLPQSIAPRRDLWPTIAIGLDQPMAARPTRIHLPWPYAIAAAIGCMALGALLSYALLQRESAPAISTESPARTSNRTAVLQASFGRYAALGPEYERARAALVIDLAERLDRLPPVARLRIERNLDEIQRAVQEINAALDLVPNDPLLQELLLNTYQDELKLLAHVNQMAGSLPART